MKARLSEIVGKVISGEWGNDDEDGMGIPVLRTTNFTNEGIICFDKTVTRQITKKNIEGKYLRKGDIIIEKSGGSDKQPVGRVVFFEDVENKYLFNNFTGVLRVKDQLKWYPKYVFYSLYINYLMGGTREYENKTTGLHNLKTEMYVNSHEVEFLLYEQQQVIANVLDKVFALIWKRKQQLEKLDELVKARFVEMFGDPVRNDKSWPMASLASLAEIKIGPFGSLLHKEDYVSGGHALVNPSHIIDSRIITDDDLTVSDNKYAEMEPYHLHAGDIVLGRRGEMGRCAVVYDEGLLCGTGSLIIRPAAGMLPYFLQKIISYPTFKESIEDMAVGVTMMNLNVPIVSNFMIPVLPLEEQKTYLRFVEQIEKSKLAIQESLEQLETLKKALMQKYFG